MRRLIALLFVGFVLAALAGCSSDDDSSNDATDVATEDAREPSSPDDDASDGGSGDDGSDRPDLGDLDDCARAAQAFAGVVAAPLTFLGGQATDEEIAEWEDQLDELKQDVPDDLADDYETIAEAYREFASALEGFSLGDMANPETRQAIEQASDSLDSDEVRQATANIEAYFESECQR
jgi:hypothetical protein